MGTDEHSWVISELSKLAPSPPQGLLGVSPWSVGLEASTLGCGPCTASSPLQKAVLCQPARGVLRFAQLGTEITETLPGGSACGRSLCWVTHVGHALQVSHQTGLQPRLSSVSSPAHNPGCPCSGSRAQRGPVLTPRLSCELAAPPTAPRSTGAKAPPTRPPLPGRSQSARGRWSHGEGPREAGKPDQSYTIPSRDLWSRVPWPLLQIQ